jgi:hypothetical protein
MGLVEDFFDTLQVYNELLLPITILTYLLGLVAVYLASRKSSQSSRFTSCILGFLWLWSGLVFNMLFYGPSDVEVLGLTVTGMWYLAGVLFVLQGLLFVMLGAIKNAFSFRLDTSSYSVGGAILVVYAMVLYPLIGLLTGYAYPRYPVFGSAPCPVTIFTLGLLLWTNREISTLVAAIPVVWGIMGIVPVLVLGIYADIGLIVSGVIGLPLILLHNRSVARESGTPGVEVTVR